MSGTWDWRVVPTRANGQPALGFYTWDQDAQTYMPFALNVLTFRGEEISDVVAFVARSTEPTERKDYERWPDQPADPSRLLAAFERFYTWIDPAGLAYFRARLTQAPRDAEHALEVVTEHCRTADEQARAVAALSFKCDVLWSMLDAIAWAYSGST